MERLPPEPITGFDAAASGVAQPQPKPVARTEGSFIPKPFCPPNGFAKLGWLRTLKNSARNWAVRRSLNFQFLATEKSQLRKPVSRNVLRPIAPNGPSEAGTIADLPFGLT